MRAVVDALDRPDGAHLLLVGPTGSGKTEVYLQAAAAALERGDGVIVLVPEIALAPQTVGRFRQRFGDTVAIVHSSLGDAERRDERERIARGDARIVVGARSAIFAPLDRVGLIVVDEEHDQAYKQESDPRYDARTVAAKRAALEGAVALYGSATPRPESWHRLERLELPARIGAPDAARPSRRPAQRGRVSALGAVAARARPSRRERWEGDPAAQPSWCRTCRPLPLVWGVETLRAVRRRADAARGRSSALPPLRVRGGRARRRARLCGSVELARVGAGTQRLETELERAVPELERIRLDADTASAPGGARDALARFAAADRVVLIGTQMVAKGHHFPGVALAAVIDADTGLTLPDFRAEERTFQLVTQLAGRSGRDASGPGARPELPAGGDAAAPRSPARRHGVPGG